MSTHVNENHPVSPRVVCAILVAVAGMAVILACSGSETTQTATPTQESILVQGTDPALAEALQAITETNTKLLDAVQAANEANAELMQKVQSTREVTALPDPEQLAAAERPDICYRSVSMQIALLANFDGPDLCAAIDIGELYRIESLQVVAVDDVKGEDFSDMPNLRSLVLVFGGDRERDYYDAENAVPNSLPAGIFAELRNLRELSIGIEGNTILQPAMFTGLPNLERLDIGVEIPNREQERQVVRFQDDIFGGMPNLQSLHMRIGDYDTCIDLSLGTFDGLNKLRSLRLDNTYVRRIPRQAFSELASLDELDLGDPAPIRTEARASVRYTSPTTKLRLGWTIGAATVAP